MNSFEYCVLAFIFLHLFILVWVLLWIKAQLDLMGGMLQDIRHSNRLLNENAYSIAKNVEEARQKNKYK